MIINYQFFLHVQEPIQLDGAGEGEDGDLVSANAALSKGDGSLEGDGSSEAGGMDDLAEREAAVAVAGMADNDDEDDDENGVKCIKCDKTFLDIFT